MRYLFISLSIMLVTSCSQQPKVILAEKINDENADSSNIKMATLPGGPQSYQFGEELHTVEAKEVLQASRYVYVKVIEGDKEYWIATSKMEVNLGDMYFYEQGLLKRNFISKEHNRIFDEIYLVSNFIEAGHGGNSGTKVRKEETRETKTVGSMKIADLVKNAGLLESKQIQLSGLVTKVNANIMGRNWIHLQDGSKDDYDLVITTKSFIPVGHKITLRGTVSLNKDFGSGYFYEILIEDAQLLQD